MYIYSVALRQGGGIGDIINPNEYGGEFYYARVFYDVLYFLIAVVIMVAIVTGIIIDAFGSSRDHRQEVEEDHFNVCFICGIERSKFDMKKGFDWHCTHEHNMYVAEVAIVVVAVIDVVCPGGIMSTSWRICEQRIRVNSQVGPLLFMRGFEKLTGPLGQESYVASLAAQGDLGFFPVDRSLMLES